MYFLYLMYFLQVIHICFEINTDKIKQFYFLNNYKLILQKSIENNAIFIM